MKVFDFVLIIDDDPVNNLICESVIKKTRTARKIQAITSISEAIQFLSQQQYTTDFPDLILLDLRFPDSEMGAWDFLEKYPTLISPEKQASTNLFVLTSSVAKMDMNSVAKYTFVKGFLTKPLTDKSIKHIIEVIGD
ncbi:MAG: response regulator [Microscillaceae bacterium]|nr:response regulator [Microscillaceae bacterium]MDW8460531.1 response regulator [Cytophagales bacterium]